MLHALWLPEITIRQGTVAKDVLGTSQAVAPFTLGNSPAPGRLPPCFLIRVDSAEGPSGTIPGSSICCSVCIGLSDT
jgi:hypothetical protein